MNSFTVVILSYNHPEITSRCVQNALQYVNAENIILFHNGSQIKFVSHLKNLFPQIQHNYEAINSGFSGGANRALKCAFTKSDWAFFITNDTEIEKLPTAFNLKPGFYAPLIWNRKRTHWDSLGGAIDLSRAKLRHLKSKDDHLKKNERFYIPGTAFLIHKSIFEKLKGFDESYETFWEDVDFSLRCQNMNLNYSTTTDFQLMHLGGKTCHKDSHYTLYLYQRNRWKLILNHWKKNKTHLPILAFTYLYDFLRLNILLLKQRRWRDCKQLMRAFSQL